MRIQNYANSKGSLLLPTESCGKEEGEVGRFRRSGLCSERTCLHFARSKKTSSSRLNSKRAKESCEPVEEEVAYKWFGQSW